MIICKYAQYMYKSYFPKKDINYTVFLSITVSTIYQLN